MSFGFSFADEHIYEIVKRSLKPNIKVNYIGVIIAAHEGMTYPEFRITS